MALERILPLLQNVRRTSNGAQATCPAHTDVNARLSISDGREDRIILKCHAGCKAEEIVAKIGWTLKDLGPSRNGKTKKAKGEVVATYDYEDADGKLIYQVVRLASPKGFFQRRPKPGGGWIKNTNGCKLVPYRLPELLKTKGIVFVVEGEKDVDRLWSEGHVATCNVGGVGKWKDEYTVYLKDRCVAIVPDNDAKGRQHSQEIAASCHGVASVRVVELPGVPEKGDVSDWLAAGHTVAELVALAKAAPNWEPPATPSKQNSISNVRRIDGHPTPIPMSELVDSILDATDNWPRRIEDSLFYDAGPMGVVWFDGPSSLFGWLSGRCGLIDWRRINGACGREETFYELRRRATPYEAIEQYPHHPTITGHYYACEMLKAGDGKALNNLLSFFTPETTVDRDLLIGAMATPLWGGLPGTRPAFMFTSTTGRGKGKSKTAEFVGRL